jgi:hypothetical protein
MCFQLFTLFAMKNSNKLILILVILVIPIPVLADAGTPLMWMSMFQLVYGNLILGILEGIATAFIYKTKWPRSVLVMIGGNYTSFLVGFFLIGIFQNQLLDYLFDIRNVFAFWIGSLVILYFITVIIELPFFRWAFLKNERNWSRSFKLSVILNAITYTSMILLCLSESKYNFFTDLKINQSLLENKTQFELYSLNKEDVFKGNITGGREKILHISNDVYYPRFELNEDSMNLFVAGYQGHKIPVQKHVIDDSEKAYYDLTDQHYRGIYADFRDTSNRTWNATSGGWAIEGITIRESDSGETNYAFEVPWMEWSIGHISIIDNSELICIINDRIILLNKDTKEIAFIAKGSDYLVKRKSNFKHLPI